MQTKFSIFNFQFSIKKLGFSLIEVLISGAIFAIVAIVGSASLTNVLKTRSYNIKNTAVNNSLRTGLEVILRETRDAHYVGYCNNNKQIYLYNKDGTLIKRIGAELTSTGNKGIYIIVSPPPFVKKFITTENTTLSSDMIVNGQFNAPLDISCNATFDDNKTPYIYVGLTADYYPESGYQKTASIVAVPRN